MKKKTIKELENETYKCRKCGKIVHYVYMENGKYVCADCSEYINNGNKTFNR